jgi:hypothetical protein
VRIAGSNRGVNRQLSMLRATGKNLNENVL